MDFVRFALRYAYSRRKPAGYIALCWLVCTAAFYFNSLPPTLPAVALLFALAPVVVLEVRRMLYVYQKHLTMDDMTEVSVKALDEFAAQYPPEESFADEDYQRLLRRCAEAAEAPEETEPDGAAFAEYYTRWAREIKEPVGAMRQLLLDGDSPLVRRMSVELRRVERYADMAAAYARQEAAPEYALRRYDLSAIVQKCLRKFNGDSLEKKIPVTFEPVPAMVVTDGKWFSFVLEQVLSNAFQYAYSGEVTVSIEKDAAAADDTADWASVSAGTCPGVGPFLCVRDGGVGMAPETLEGLFAAPQNGLGLYLCRRICEGLGHSISVASKEGEGTLVRLEVSVEIPESDEDGADAVAAPPPDEQAPPASA